MVHRAKGGCRMMTVFPISGLQPGDVIKDRRYGMRYTVTAVSGATITIESAAGYQRPVSLDRLRRFYRYA